MSLEIMEYLPGMAIGKGFDTVRRDIKVSPAVVGSISPPVGAAGQTGQFNLVVVKGSEEFESSLGINSSVSGGWGPFSASAKFDFKKKCKVSRQATFCVLSFSATNAFESFSDPKFTAEAEELLRLNEMERFRQRFGDRFINGWATGGEFFGSVRIEAESEEKQTEIALQVKASFGRLFSASGGFDKDTASKISKESLEIFVMQTGGNVVPVFNLQELYDTAVKAAQDVRQGKGVPFSVILESYDELKLPTDNISFVQQQHAKEVMRKLGEHYNRLLELQNDIDFVLRNQDFFEKFDVRKLNEANQQITNDLNTIAERADKCTRDFSQCEHFSPTIPAINLPDRKGKSQRKPPTRTPSRTIQASQLRSQAAAFTAIARSPNTSPAMKSRYQGQAARLLAQAKQLES